jgi:PilZ domain-containing protein
VVPDVTDRRRHARVPADQARWRAVRLRTGHPLSLVNLAPGGALVESSRRLLPGTTVILQVSLDEETLSVPALVVRCTVHALSSDAVQYRGALAFAGDQEACAGAAM